MAGGGVGVLMKTLPSPRSYRHLMVAERGKGIFLGSVGLF